MLHLYPYTVIDHPSVTGRPVYGPGVPEPASLHRNAEHARVLKQAKATQATRTSRQPAPGIVTRLRRVVGLA